MTRKASERVYQTPLLTVIRWLAGIAVTCARQKPRLYAPMQSDGYSAQPVGIVRRFADGADLDPATRTPVGDEGYYLHILNDAANWDYSSTKSLLFSIWQRPWAHSWIILESPGDRLECGHTGNWGKSRRVTMTECFRESGMANPIPSLTCGRRGPMASSRSASPTAPPRSSGEYR